MHRETQDGLTRREAVLALVGGAAALFGTYWDDVWHTDRGRDTLAAPPHLALYAGVLVALAVAAGWARRVGRAHGWRTALGARSPVRLAVVGGVAVLLAAPVDELWHSAYGRDAVLWSPPHLLAIAGSVALTVGLVLGLAPRTAAAAAGAALAVGAYVVPVMEFESDVPQFPTSLYLPVLAVGLVLAAPVVRHLVGGRWPLTVAAAVYTVARAAIAAGLAGLDHSTVVVPPLVVVAAAVDVVSRRGRPALVPLAIGIGLHVVYVPFMQVVPHGLVTSADDVAMSLALAVVAALVASLVNGSWVGGATPVSRSGLLMAMLLGAALGPFVAASPAAAHDPGQGDARGTADFSVDGADEVLLVSVDLPAEVCDAGDVSIVGRRGGRTIRTTAEVVASCRAAGTLRVDEPGRWFVYVEQGRLESWVPVDVGGSVAVQDTRELYERPAPSSRAGRRAAAVPLVLAAGALLVGASRSAGRLRTEDAGRARGEVP